MRSKKPQRDVPFYVDVGIALALVLTITFFILVMADRFGVTGPGPGQMQSGTNVLVAHEPTNNQHN